MHLWQTTKSIASLLKDTVVRWAARDPFRNSVVIAWYTVFSLPGLLVIVVSIAGYFWGEEAVTNEIKSQIGGMIGPETASAIQTMIASASTDGALTISSLLGLLTLVFGATGVFYQLQQVLDIMWEVKPAPQKTARKILKQLKDRLFSFGLILTVGFLLLVSLALSTVLTILSNWVARHFSDTLSFIFRFLDFGLSLSVITLLFAAIYKYLPDVEIRWRDVSIGAFVTALLFMLAKYGLELYFSNSDPGSTYGAAGSIILIMLWTNYSALILLLGAEFTQVYASRYGVGIRPSEFAVSTKNSPDKKDTCADFKSRTEIDS